MSGSGTGTPAVSPSTVTAQDLIDDAIRPALDDALAAEFTDAELLSFLNEAIREYTQHFPRITETIIAAVAGETRYALPWDATAVISVEHPVGDDPPTWLRRWSKRASGFAHIRAYDIEWTHDLTAAPALLLSFAPETGTSLAVRTIRPHDSALTASSNLTVPARHHHVLIQYVLFAATRQLQAREQAAPTNNSSLLMAQLASNTRRLQLAYLNALNRILSQQLGEGEIFSWDW